MRAAWAVRLAVLLLPAAAAAPVEEIDLDLPPSERWSAFAKKYRKDIVARCQHMGKMYMRGLGEEVTARWVKAAPLDDEMRAEYEGMIKAVDHPSVTLDCLVITDMWQAVNSPSLECTGLLAAMPNGTVIHGRNIDYDTAKVAQKAMSTGAGVGGNTFFDGVLKKGGKPIAEFLALAGSLGTHTGMRLGAYSVNSNARLINNRMLENLKAQEAGARNFPWVLRKMLETVPDFDLAVQLMEKAELNAPNYFIFAGSEPYQGAVVTKDRLGHREPTTPPTQRLSKEKGIWYLVQTNDDLLSPPEDNRRGSALVRLSGSRQSLVDEDFVLNEMQTPPIKNSDTLVTWVANPRAGTHRLLMRPGGDILGGLASKVFHRTFHIPMPQDLPKGGGGAAKKDSGSSALRGSLGTE